MTIPKLVEFLREMGVRPCKRRSQHFLIDPNIVTKLLQLADIRPGDHVLEIGPGPGAITQALLNAGAHVLAVEIDRNLAAELPRLQTADNRLQTHCADFLTFDIPKDRHWKVVSNLPYHITAPILIKLCEQAELLSSYTLIVQKEVGARIRAKPRTKEYSSFTLFLQFYTSCVSSFPISKSCFFPAPNVESMAIRLNPQTPPEIDAGLFFPLVRKAFCQRRKMLTSSLGRECQSILRKVGLSDKARPEELSLQEWIAFANLMRLV